jgi:hypothetical protein
MIIVEAFPPTQPFAIAFNLLVNLQAYCKNTSTRNSLLTKLAIADKTSQRAIYFSGFFVGSWPMTWAGNSAGFKIKIKETVFQNLLSLHFRLSRAFAIF